MLPSICTEERITLGAELEDGTVVRGQNEISHPSLRGSTSGGGEWLTPARLPWRFCVHAAGCPLLASLPRLPPPPLHSIA